MSPSFVVVFAFCTPRTADVREQGRDDLTFAEFGGGTDGRTAARAARRGSGASVVVASDVGGEQAVACFALFAKHDQTHHDPIRYLIRIS